MFEKNSDKKFPRCSKHFRCFGIYLPNDVGHIRNLKKFRFYSQKCWALWKYPDDPPKKKLGSLGI
jgi:hypothetical protein